MSTCPKCGAEINAPDMHYTSSILVAEIADLRAQLAGAKAEAAKYRGLYEQAIAVAEKAVAVAKE
jgi:hypothetical protein